MSETMTDFIRQTELKFIITTEHAKFSLLITLNL